MVRAVHKVGFIDQCEESEYITSIILLAPNTLVGQHHYTGLSALAPGGAVPLWCAYTSPLMWKFLIRKTTLLL